MWTALLVGAFAATTPLSEQTDTTFAVPSDVRVEIENYSGSIELRTWNRDAVRVVAEHSDGDRIQIRRGGSRVHINSSGRYGPAQNVDFVITVPARAPLRISGPFSDITVDGAGSDVLAQTVRGDVEVRGGNGLIELRSVEGDVTLRGARGRITLGGVNEDVRATEVSGDMTVETVNGDVSLERITSSNVVASTVNGDIVYDGTITRDGRYGLTTHNGDVVIGIPADADATVSIATYNGEVESVLPIMVTEIRRNKRFSFTVGQGIARIDLESFNGTIRIRRPSAGTNLEN